MQRCCSAPSAAYLQMTTPTAGPLSTMTTSSESLAAHVLVSPKGPVLLTVWCSANTCGACKEYNMCQPMSIVHMPDTSCLRQAVAQQQHPICQTPVPGMTSHLVAYNILGSALCRGSCKFYNNIPEWYGAWPDSQAGFPNCG